MIIGSRILFTDAVRAQSATQVTALVTIPSGKVSSSLVGFQVKIDLADLSTAFWSVLSADGGNLRAYNASGTQIPIDIPFYDKANKVGWAFIRLDVPTTGTSFYLKAISGYTAIPDSDPNGMGGVWAGMAAVQSGNSLKNRATATSTAWTPMPGTTEDFTTRPGWLTVAASGATQGPIMAPTFGYANYIWTMSATARYIKPAGGHSADDVVLSFANYGWDTAGNTTYFNCFGRSGQGTATNDNFFDWWSTGAYSNGTTNLGGFTPNVDNRVALTVNNFAHTIFMAGVARASSTASQRIFSSSTVSQAKLYMGCPYGALTAARFIGNLSDAYMTLGEQSPARLKAEHDNWNWVTAGKGFYTIT